MFGVPEWAIGIVFIILASSVARAVFRVFAPPSSSPPFPHRARKASLRDLTQALDDMQRRLGELEEAQRRLGAGDDVEARLSEVEERLDFTERLLAKQRDPGRLDPPKP
jgi:hypothetical protein